MNKKGFLKDFSLVFISNLLGLILSVAMNLVIPVLFGEDVHSYGYIQLYLLYIGYYYLFTLGMCNGIYLREGGKSFDSLKKDVYSGQFLLMTVSQIAFGLILIVVSLIFCKDSNKLIVYIATSICIVILSVKEMLSVMFQATSKMKEYSLMTILSKLTNALVIFFAFLIGIKNYKILLLCFVLGESLSLCYAIFKCRKIIFSKPCSVKATVKEIGENIFSGYTILISGLTGMLITGFAKLCVEDYWGIETFAKISFTISLANLFMVFVNAVSVVLYPRLKSVGEEEHEKTYSRLNFFTIALLFVGMGLCYPARLALESFLPQYKESLSYISILLPMCVFIGKTSMVTQTYMKALRLEKQLMLSNLVSFGISATFVALSVYRFNDLMLVVYGVLMGQMLRAILCEIFLSGKIKINVIKNVIVECAFALCFILTHWSVGGWIGTVIYITLVLIYVVPEFILSRKKLKNSNV